MGMKWWGVAIGLGTIGAAWAAHKRKPGVIANAQLNESFIDEIAGLCVVGLAHCLDNDSESVRHSARNAIANSIRNSDYGLIDAEPVLRPMMRVEMRVRRVDHRRVERALGIVWMRQSGTDTVMAADEVMWEDLPGQYRERFIREGSDQQVYLLYQRARLGEGESEWEGD